MNTILSTASRRHDHPPSPASGYPATPPRRVGRVDRLALHLGVALIKWGRRPGPFESRERRASRYEQHIARLARERAAERALWLILPRR